MAPTLQDAACRALRTGANPSQGDTLVDVRLGNVQIIRAESFGGLGVGHGRSHDLVHRLRSSLRSELQCDEGVIDVHAANEIDDATDLHRAHPDVTRDGVRARTIPEQDLTATAVAVFVAHS